jgi:folate-dependent phosphoribosylglycinamide formyltransferase PurN
MSSQPSAGSGASLETQACDIVILAGDGPPSWILVNAVRRRFGPVPVIVEDKEPAGLFLRRRIRRLGVIAVAGQIAFIVLARILSRFHKHAEQAIFARENLDPSPISGGVMRVSSVNDAATLETLRRLTPKVVVLSGTRVVARRVLEGVMAVFLNVHAGITPQYRGVHGGYWALVEGEPENCGVTVHVVDAGVDTGAVVSQARIRPLPADNYLTYPWLQLAAALPLLIAAIEDALAGRLVTVKPAGEEKSRQYYHPTLWGYVWTGLRRGVW